MLGTVRSHNLQSHGARSVTCALTVPKLSAAITPIGLVMIEFYPHIFTQVFLSLADNHDRLCGGLGLLRQYPNIN